MQIIALVVKVGFLIGLMVVIVHAQRELTRGVEKTVPLAIVHVVVAKHHQIIAQAAQGEIIWIRLLEFASKHAIQELIYLARLVLHAIQIVQIVQFLPIIVLHARALKITIRILKKSLHF